MTRREVVVGPSNGELVVHTGVAGPAARVGHRLTIVMGDWRGVAVLDDEIPVEVTLHVEVESLAVEHGEGGVKPLSDAEKAVARSNALRSLESSRYPSIDFQAAQVEPTSSGYQLIGRLTIHGVTKNWTVDLTVEEGSDEWRLACDEEVRQTDFGVTPYALMFGSLKVADEVTVSFSALSTQRPQER